MSIDHATIESDDLLSRLVLHASNGTSGGGVHSRIVQGVGAAIVSGQLKPGERLPNDAAWKSVV